MGLLFPVQPNLRHSQEESLVLESSTNRFSVGLSFLFVGLIIATMYIAAAPLFDRMWEEGALFDKALTAFFYGIIILYPIVAFVCWGYREKVRISRNKDGRFKINRQLLIAFIKLKEKEIDDVSFEELQMTNWKGAINVAALSKQNQDMARYATRGHWLLNVKDQPDWVIERRARKEDIEWLMAQIKGYFFPEAASS